MAIKKLRQRLVGRIYKISVITMYQERSFSSWNLNLPTTL